MWSLPTVGKRSSSSAKQTYVVCGFSQVRYCEKKVVPTKPETCTLFTLYSTPRAKLYETHHVSLRQIVEKDVRNIEKQQTFVAENFVSQILAMLTSCRHGGDREIRQNTKT